MINAWLKLRYQQKKWRTYLVNKDGGGQNREIWMCLCSALRWLGESRGRRAAKCGIEWGTFFKASVQKPQTLWHFPTSEADSCGVLEGHYRELQCVPKVLAQIETHSTLIVRLPVFKKAFKDTITLSKCPIACASPLLGSVAGAIKWILRSVYAEADLKGIWYQVMLMYNIIPTFTKKRVWLWKGSEVDTKYEHIEKTKLLYLYYRIWIEQ